MMVWEIPKMWEGGECWIIGGGPSIIQEFGVPENVVEAVRKNEASLSTYSPYLSPIHSKHTIGVNAAFLLGNWIDIMFFGDSGFYFRNMHELARFKKIKVCCSPSLLEKPPPGIRFVRKSGRNPRGISTKHDMVSWNNNSGAASISMAVQLGVKKIYLLGFDMDLDESGYQHWHDHYKKGNNRQPMSLPFSKHIMGFSKIAEDAKKLGIEIVNVSPNSKIEVFPRVKLSEVL